MIKVICDRCGSENARDIIVCKVEETERIDLIRKHLCGHCIERLKEFFCPLPKAG